jgi:hypothetical protein
MARLLALAKANGGTISSSQVEADRELSSERELVSAAARALAGGTNVLSAQEDDGRTWFPFSSLSFGPLPAVRV